MQNTRIKIFSDPIFSILSELIYSRDIETIRYKVFLLVSLPTHRVTYVKYVASKKTLSKQAV
jgi:hypothetical protein